MATGSRWSSPSRTTREGHRMAKLLTKIMLFVRSPQGQRAVAEVRRAAADPRRRAQAQQALGKLRGRR
jgi:hypothetical protein